MACDADVFLTDHAHARRATTSGSCSLLLARKKVVRNVDGGSHLPTPADRDALSWPEQLLSRDTESMAISSVTTLGGSALRAQGRKRNHCSLTPNPFVSRTRKKYMLSCCK